MTYHTVTSIIYHQTCCSRSNTSSVYKAIFFIYAANTVSSFRMCICICERHLNIVYNLSSGIPWRNAEAFHVFISEKGLISSQFATVNTHTHIPVPPIFHKTRLLRFSRRTHYTLSSPRHFHSLHYNPQPTSLPVDARPHLFSGWPVGLSSAACHVSPPSALTSTRTTARPPPLSAYPLTVTVSS